uniref:G-protein coupled receptors family 1 profile domain-containing protein n=1 Tax=Pyxicephalus adspersus TaxID=30357 RepID=A0AAV2ZY22_PYXAD|nr:TPA: hypothetical protein GDO54_018333 [Pyxicephalus adspersus]
MNYNTTIVTEFILLGFLVSPALEIVLFIVILFIYTLSIVINGVITVTVVREPRLHKPMYFFIAVFSFLELWYPTFYFHFALGATENSLLVVMALDRYIAICKPLHYMSIMSPRICVQLAVGAWISGFTLLIIEVKLACSETTYLRTIFFVITSFGILGCFLLILVSYTFIINTILRLPTSTGRRKTFYTCASHMTVVLIFYTTTIFMFIRPAEGSNLHINKMVSVFPSVVTPLLNPIIYTLRNQEVKNTLMKAFH